jgi:hypothetical protein
MKTWVEYYDISPISGELYHPCGDRSVVRLDSRNSLDTMHMDARENNGHRRPVYQAYRLIKGYNLLHAKPITDIIKL